jgi:hypothetical protein
MRWSLSAFAVCGIFTCLHPAIASQAEQSLNAQLGTLWVKAAPDFVDGELQGCILEYAVFARDFVHKQGAPILIAGSVGLRVLAPRGIATTLKVIVHDIDPLTGALVPSAPTRAYFVSGNKTTKEAIIGAVPSDTPGGLLVLMKTDATFEIVAQGIEDHKLTIAFGRKVGGSDLLFTLDPSVVETADDGRRTKSPTAALEFFECNESLLNELKKTANE